MPLVEPVGDVTKSFDMVYIETMMVPLWRGAEVVVLLGGVDFL